MLSNCHLSISWMPELVKIVEGLNEHVKEDFRLWLTTMPNKAFPTSII